MDELSQNSDVLLIATSNKDLEWFKTENNGEYYYAIRAGRFSNYIDMPAMTLDERKQYTYMLLKEYKLEDKINKEFIEVKPEIT